ncbi:MAG TPA: hypothetical protein VE640_07430 [Candidatus Bathyarchaeia archaeon]|nr:hypothetical protein [Candidatus Bathyarchaeia archaeon]
MIGPTLDELGWSVALAADHAPHAALGREPARVMAEDRGSYRVRTAAGERRAAITGRFRHEAGADPSVFPAVGDWVAVDGGPDDTAIHAVLSRRTAFVRQASGNRTEAQVVGANVDLVGEHMDAKYGREAR